MGNGKRDLPIVPAGLWDRPEMAEAQARRDMGTVVRLFRRWTGASQTVVGALVGLPQPQVSGLERGRRQITSLEVFERFTDGFGIPRRLLGLAGAEPDVLARAVAGGGVNYRIDEANAEVAASHREWPCCLTSTGPGTSLDVRRKLNLNRSRLTRIARDLYPKEWHLGGTGILMPESWRLDEPMDLTSIGLSWQAEADVIVTGQCEESRRLQPLTAQGRRYHRYHRAMGDLDRPRLYENRVCYRLLEVAWPERALTLGSMSYFDMIDGGEALAHELAMVAVDSHGEVNALNYVGDVFTVAVFDADVFDYVFKGLVDQNDEGDVVRRPEDQERRQFTFDDETIHRLLTNEPVAPSGAACLSLASAHRTAILG